MVNPLIALISDFGSRDPFVGIMKGVLATINPVVSMVDISHEIPPGDLLKAAVSLWQATPYFPTGTIFLCVVDPGVGTTRKPIVLVTEKHTFVGPDNGIFSFICGKEFHIWEIHNPNYLLPSPSSTFHGRDVFAPAAAHISLRLDPSDLGPTVETLTRLPNPRLSLQTNDRIIGEVLFADHFGNCLTSLGRFDNQSGAVDFEPWLGGVPHRRGISGFSIHLPEKGTLPMAKTFGQIESGKCAGILGSSGLLEIAANGKSAADILDLKRRETVELHFKSKD